MLVIDQTGNQRGKGSKDCLIGLGSSVSILYLSNNVNQLMLVIDQTGNQRGKGSKDCLIGLGSSVSILSY